MNRDLALEWFDRWERQQERYAVGRTDRFEVICDVLATGSSPPQVVVDLGCGPGSLAAVVSHAFPECSAIAVDVDPFLLEIGATVHPHIEFRQADLGDPGWTRDLCDRPVSAVVTSTALHYPPAPVLAGIYRECSHLLRPGGMLVNADHLSADSPGLRTVESVVAERVGARQGVVGRETWTQWWDAVTDEPEFADLLARRSREVPPHVADNELTVDQHRSIMLASGFDEAGTVWQVGMSTVMVGIARASR
ncbi:class I SAM-dependent methyltransferase [Gordonia sp. NPDC127522]|uniref:class I SAM-dependent methyltransferase n=1 Tax=Gordonia sp. NPDC127522 TaxID=3345390 RepID=UPI00364128AD